MPKQNGSGWSNEENGKVISNHRTKDNAVSAGRSVAKREHVEHTIHKKDGTIGEKNSYGRDPDPPKDKDGK